MLIYISPNRWIDDNGIITTFIHIFCNAKRYLQIENGDLVGSTEEMANRVMANLIKQLASLGRHAHDIFGKP